ncbi:bifunctional diguanylate cyclase/phosphodiesterase [Rhizobium lentis]|uniref:EAL domain-containing protein n=1 Tax=Rhizobium lentis TaxID=1138194 RepID=A0ABS7IPI6_9HYPH|nr:EAL domain-containing protein [Rhizobium lentis]MBX4959377.1 EAL domain-containing protein [Rhizobium lentis]MBX4989512.1 EAL domain-containing protein [Rhizobium lentis]MBX5007832.1 EAL domain-containing protein [Rhizobium lentis]MBX5014118.1 EAL domain-containing protein [Rhizobium lentis]MBX5093745.1 EAL domain-containing protein [Rhizobium lentis]
MLSWLGDSKQLRHVLKNSRVSFLVSSFVALVVIMVGFALDRANTAAHVRELHIRTESEMNLLRARVKAEIDMDLSMVQDLANLTSISNAASREEMERQINWLLIQNPAFIHIAVAPGFIVGDVYPPGPGSERIGRDVREELFSRQAMTRAAGDQLARFYGPITTNGRDAFAIFFPVFVRENGHRRLWGAVEVAIDRKMFYEATGLTPSRDSENQERYPNLDHLSIAVRDIGPTAGKTDAAAPFFGSAGIDDKDPIRRQISFAGGKWELSAVPKDSWSAVPENRTELLLIVVAAGCIIVVPIFFATLLLGERNRNIAELETREAKLMELSQRLNLALESSNIGIWELQDHSNSLLWDARAAALHGKPAEEGSRPLDEWLAAILPADRDIAEVHFFSCSIAGATCTAQYRILLGNGGIRHLRSVGALYRDAGGAGRTIGIVWDVTADAEVTDALRKARDVSEVKNAELELALEELSSREGELAELSSRLDLALNSYQCGIWEAQPDRGGSIWNERMHELYGLQPRNAFMTEETWLSRIHPDDRGLALESARHLKRSGDTHTLVCRVIVDDGSVRYVRSVGKVHQTASGELKIMGIAFDATEDMLMTIRLKAAKDEAVAKNIELELAKDRIEHNSLHDPLTALANRRKLDIALERLSHDGRRQRQKFSILHIDLDRFKDINDTLGHAAGDAMLVHASKVLARNVRGSDLVARIGGDEFVILAVDVDDKEMAELATRIIEEMRQPIDFQGFSCRCGVSIGIALANGIHVDARKVLINADIALYRAKSTGRNRFEFFNHDLQAHIINTKRTADEIFAGIDNGEFTAWYQPQFSARTMELTGVEALVRWKHPSKGWLAPDKFLRIAEEINVVQTLDRIVLETALRDRLRLVALGIALPKVSVNVSARRLHDGSLLDSLADLNIRPGELSFELVESIFLDESEDVVSHNLERIKALGIDIEIDDFGTGHTSIVSLLKLKPKRLKIDRQLVQPIIGASQERALVRSIIDIARSLGVETVAEGVETAAHAALLRDLGCDILQGYAFSPALSFDDFAAEAAGTGWRLAS